MTALDKALESLIGDPADGERYTAATAVRDNWDGVPAGASSAVIQGIIRDHINGHKLVLLGNDNLGDASKSPSTTWVFRLIAGMGDTHYVYVDRNGSKETYQEIS